MKDEELERFGIFGRNLEVQNTFEGIDRIACTFGLSGIEPTIVLMDWPGQTKEQVWFKEMTEKHIEIDYNVLYMGYDHRWGFRKKQKIDLWWRTVGNNAELMLSLAKLIISSPDWSQANIRILLANDALENFKEVENRILAIVEQCRVKAEIKIITNETDQKPIYDLMKIHSSEADLVFVGIPQIEPDDHQQFVESTNNLMSVIGTTLLVKASSQFEEAGFKPEQISLKHEPRILEQAEIIQLRDTEGAGLTTAITDLDNKLEELTTSLIQNGVQPVEDYHHTIFLKVIERMDDYLLNIRESPSVEVQTDLENVLAEVKNFYADALDNQLPIVYDGLDKEIQVYFSKKEELYTYLPKKVQTEKVLAENGKWNNIQRKVQYRNSIQRFWYAKGIKDDFSALLEFGYQNLILLHQSKNILHDAIGKLLENIGENGIEIKAISECKNQLDTALQELDEEAQHLASNLYRNIRNNEREVLNQLSDTLLRKNYQQELQDIYTPLPNKEFQQIRKGTVSFPSYWYRNLILFTYHLEADIYLIAYTAKAQEITGEISSYTKENYLAKINENISELYEQIKHLKTCIVEDKEEELLGTTIRISEELFFNSEYVVSKLLLGMSKINTTVPEEIELMTAKSINGIREVQGIKVQTEKIALRDITEYLSKIHFVDPLHECIQVFYEQFKRTTGKLINTIGQIQKGIDTYSVSGKINALKEVIEQTENEIAQVRSDFEAAQSGFELELKKRQSLLREKLDINQIIEQVETLRQYVRQKKRRNTILDRVKQVNQKTTKKVSGLLNYLAQRQQDITAVEYKNRYTNVLSEQGQIAEFMEMSGAQADLPFYYQQLFTGTYYSDSKTIENRRLEIEKIRSAIQRINAGRSGAIVILGSAGSGKSYLAAHTSNHLLSGRIYKVLPPVNRTWTKDDLLLGIQRATGVNESLSKIFNKLQSGSSIIFEDIEQWWLKAENGEQIINELAKVINKFGSKHYFILTSNIHSFGLIGRSTNIQDAIIQSIILAPLNAMQIKSIIWSRHQTGGLQISLGNKHEQHVSVSELSKYLNRYHATSGGNIGLALHQWINSIQSVEDNHLVMRNPILRKMPMIEKEEWKNLIFQLFIHYNLSREELYRIYGDENKNWINRSLQSLKNVELVEENGRGEFIIVKVSKPYIENWLNELGFIK